MSKRFVSLWFPHLLTDRIAIRRPALRDKPFVLAGIDRERKMVTAACVQAETQRIVPGMTVGDARAILPGLVVLDDQPDLGPKLLLALARWCIRFTPVAAVDAPDGLVLDVSGCTHLWGADRAYLEDMVSRLRTHGYELHAAMAATIGAAWALARYSEDECRIAQGTEPELLYSLPIAALRLETDQIDLLRRMGLRTVGQLERLPRAALRRRFDHKLLLRLDQAMGRVGESIEPVDLPVEWAERLPCLEPIATRTGVEIALSRLLESLCAGLQQAGKGLRTAVLTGYRIDARKVDMTIATNRPSHHAGHLFRLFEIHIDGFEPGPGIELFTLSASKVEDAAPRQEKLWGSGGGLIDPALAETLDRVATKIGAESIRRYLPAEHHWPERSMRAAPSLDEEPASPWPLQLTRPLHLLHRPEPIEVAAPIPDYPPMHFRYKGRLHRVEKADGPERIANEWWLDSQAHRDYYAVEDEEGVRYWIFRAGYYAEGGASPQWFLHGYLF